MNTKRKYHRRAYVIEDVAHLMRAGESPAVIASRLGMTPAAVARALYRDELHETARTFEATRRATEAHPCMDCGTTVTSREAPRCRRCGCLERERAKRERVAA